jgi:hypothetical protein
MKINTNPKINLIILYFFQPWNKGIPDVNRARLLSSGNNELIAKVEPKINGNTITKIEPNPSDNNANTTIIV